MKGIVFNLLARVVQHERGEDAWDALLETAACDGVYTSLGTYPGTELVRLIRAAARMWQTSPRAILRWLGRKAVPLLASDHPDWFADRSRSRWWTIHDAICVALRKRCDVVLDSGFNAVARDDGGLWMCCCLSRRPAGLTLGCVEGVADYFGGAVDVDESKCMQKGDTACSLVMRFSKAG